MRGELGNGSKVEKVVRAKAVTGPISTNGVSREHSAAATSDAPGRMRAGAMRGLGEVELKTLGEEQQAVEEAARQYHVVVEDEQPVVVQWALARGRSDGEQAVDVLELPGVAGR